jgi:phosphohistidine phosphatase
VCNILFQNQKGMKTLILLRHAKSEDPDQAATDFQRHLKNRGRRDILKVAEKSIQDACVPGLILCSSAIRTRETLDLYLSMLSAKPRIQYLDALYHASASEILDVVLAHADEAETIMVVGHNMGLSVLASLLSETDCPELPTSGMVIFNFEAECAPGMGKRLHFYTPESL